jgi:hypothetical protein
MNMASIITDDTGDKVIYKEAFIGMAVDISLGYS